VAPEVPPHFELAARRPEPAAATPSPSWRRGPSYLAEGSLTRGPPASRNARSGRGRNHTSGPGLPGGAGRASVSSGWLCQPEEAQVSGTVRSVFHQPMRAWGPSRTCGAAVGREPGNCGGPVPSRERRLTRVGWGASSFLGDPPLLRPSEKG